MKEKKFTRRQQALNELYKVQDELCKYRGMPDDYDIYCSLNCTSSRFPNIKSIVEEIERLRKFLTLPPEPPTDKQLSYMRGLLNIDYNHELRDLLGDKIPNKYQVSFIISNLVDVKKCLTFGSSYDMHPDEFDKIDADIKEIISKIPD